MSMILILDDQENEKIIRYVLDEMDVFLSKEIPYPRNVGLSSYLDGISGHLTKDLLIEIKYHQMHEADLCELKRDVMVKVLLAKKLQNEYPELFEVVRKTAAPVGGKFEFIEQVDLDKIQFDESSQQPELKTLAELKSKEIVVRAISNETEVIVETNSIGKGVFPDGEPEDLYNERGWITVATLPLSPGVMRDMMQVMSHYLKLAA